MVLYLRLLRESFGFAVNALRNNKLRTFLSLLGVTIGIFSIIAILTAVDSLEQKIKKDLNTLDKNTIFLTSLSFGPTDIPEWKREQFPKVSYDEYEKLKGTVQLVDAFSYQFWVAGQPIKYESKSTQDLNLVPVTNEFSDIRNLEFDKGRFFNESESQSGKAVIVLGFEVAKTLFDDADPLGKTVRLYGQRFTVIGVLKKMGSSFNFGGSDDASAFLPVNYLRRAFGDNNKSMMSVILVKPVEGVDMDEVKAELRQKLRNIRGLRIEDGDNFFVNVFAGTFEMVDTIMGFLNTGGWIISGFSLLVGGFGIANIMFVSVKERTNLIGIQKSLGAKNKFILFQFLFEAVILSFFGGAIGLLM
ncbi:MAG: ABC transporter permease, partial [Flavobacterium sp.]